MITVSLAIEDKGLWDEVHACLNSEAVQFDGAQRQVSDMVAFTERLRRSHPDLIFFDAGSVRGPVEPALESIRAASPQAFLVALNTKADATHLLECFHGGANEYLVPPVADGIRKVLGNRIASVRRNEQTRGRVVAFLSAKGGCGATTVACHVAAEMARLHHKVLLADFDVENGMVGFLMHAESPYSIVDAFRNTHRLDDSFWGALVARCQPGVDTIIAPASVEARRLPGPKEVELVLDYARSSYEWTVVDLGRGLSPYTLSVIESVNELCLVAEPQLQSLRQARAIVQTLIDSGYSADRIHLVLNRVTRWVDMAPAEIQDILKLPIFANLKERDGELRDALAQGTLLLPASELGRQFEQLARKMTGERQEVKHTFWPFRKVAIA